VAVRAYPDPESVVYATTLPPRFRCTMAIRTASARFPIHAHGVYMDRAGNGNTDTNVSHFHYVRNGVVMPSNVDGHTHELSRLPCGAG
jgi:hypothetical protein